MKKGKVFKIIFIIIIFVVALAIGYKFISEKNIFVGSNILKSNVEIDIKEREYLNVEEKVFYTSELIEYKSRLGDEDNIINYYQSIAEFLKENFPDVKVYISNFNYKTNYDTAEEEMYFNGYRMVDGVILNESSFTLIMGKDRLVNDLSFGKMPTFINRDIDLSNILNASEIIEKVELLFRENSDKIFNGFNTERKIAGEYYLEYDEEKLYYVFLVNNGSYIKIDANNGEVIDTYYFNGMYS